MTSFKNLNNKLYQKAEVEKTPDYVYWKQLTAPVLVKEFGQIDYIDFAPVEPYNFAVTCSVRVQIYNPITKMVTKNFSRFRENAYGATFRGDGKVLCCGGEEAIVKLFDIGSKSLLRLFKGHTAPVHRTYFTHEKPHIASFSDDKSVRVWDIPSEQVVHTYSDHRDYIRAGAMCASLPNILLSGSYDHTARLYDMRTDTATVTVDHGSPIEAALFLPSGGVFITAGGTHIKVWDTLALGRHLATVSNHHKTVTCLKLASNGKRLLSGSLDRHVKIYDVTTYSVVHTLDYPNAILSVGVSKNDDTVVVGMVDGLVAISRRDTSRQQKTAVTNNRISYRYVSSTVDTVVASERASKQSKHDRCLRKFQYAKALREVLRPYVYIKTPEVTVGLMRELMRRKALNRVFSELESKDIITVLKFLRRNVTDYRFTRVLFAAVDVFLDVFGSELALLPLKALEHLQGLQRMLKEEVALVTEMGAIHGTMQMLLASSQVDPDLDTRTAPAISDLAPSAGARKKFVIAV